MLPLVTRSPDPDVDFALAPGRDGPVKRGRRAASARAHLLDEKGLLALIQDAERMLDHSTFKDLLEIMGLLFDNHFRPWFWLSTR